MDPDELPWYVIKEDKNWLDTSIDAESDVSMPFLYEGGGGEEMQQPLMEGAMMEGTMEQHMQE
jgi:hypothetical protein